MFICQMQMSSIFEFVEVAFRQLKCYTNVKREVLISSRDLIHSLDNECIYLKCCVYNFIHVKSMNLPRRFNDNMLGLLSLLRVKSSVVMS